MPTFPQFPDYDDTLTIPNGWVDISWHNNACPSIAKEVNKKLSVVIWCDYKAPEKRRDGEGNFQDSTRFYVSIENDGHELTPYANFYVFEHALVHANSLANSLSKGE